ncbi:MAG TPA: bifunctional DNA-formamidopyrimidine glycosylase/DNA-(apurinic or apyrimidinic site) lyase [Alphaproteobacteria bacterium]|nr:bifunctional DNA-formamidopyrimidine glycosylase/DNA-(apurinic or apyrimidinic site) lyase [Alphaproteobacteria bacterium]HNS44907.1 bifunctional DNA-formamidopyrimidine glycosylase/DNA-(apurinic or apyrimidinic site) lyase [Alphaproteobacteria bacterium]
MPELPEVETVLSGLKQVFLNRTIVGVKINTPKLRNKIPLNLAPKLRNAKVIAASRRAKYMKLDLDNDHTLVVHLGMSGVLRTELANAKKTKQTHDHLRLTLDNGTEIVYRDPRRFGVIDLVKTEEVDNSAYFRNLGPEPLSRKFSAAYLQKTFANKTVPIKQAIMDQKIVVGVGNIYASESLFLAKIDPRRVSKTLKISELEQLVSAIKKVLKHAIKEGGSTLRDYRNIGGERGLFQMHFSVYDREGKVCPHCTCNLKKTGGIKRIVQGGRSTFYCPQKQR